MPGRTNDHQAQDSAARPSHDADADAATARQQGVTVGTLTRFYAGPVTSNGLVIGYGGAPRAQVAHASKILRQILTGHAGK